MKIRADCRDLIMVETRVWQRRRCIEGDANGAVPARDGERSGGVAGSMARLGSEIAEERASWLTAQQRVTGKVRAGGSGAGF